MNPVIWFNAQVKELYPEVTFKTIWHESPNTITGIHFFCEDKVFCIVWHKMGYCNGIDTVECAAWWAQTEKYIQISGKDMVGHVSFEDTLCHMIDIFG